MRLCICSIYLHIYTHICIYIFMFIYIYKIYTYTYLYRYMCIAVTKWHVICTHHAFVLNFYMSTWFANAYALIWYPLWKCSVSGVHLGVSAKPPKKPRTQSLHWWYFNFLPQICWFQGILSKWPENVRLNMMKKSDWCNLLTSIPFRVTG